MKLTKEEESLIQESLQEDVDVFAEDPDHGVIMPTPRLDAAILKVKSQALTSLLEEIEQEIRNLRGLPKPLETKIKFLDLLAQKRKEIKD